MNDTLIRTAASTTKRAKIAVLITSRLGIADDLKAVQDLGATVARIAIHCEVGFHARPQQRDSAPQTHWPPWRREPTRSTVYSSFLLDAERAAARFGVDVADIRVELRRRGIVGGQEDMIVDVVVQLAERRAAPTA